MKKTMIVDDGRQDLLAWKCSEEDFEFGAQLVVHESQQAVFFRDGQALQVLGPGMHTLETGNLPFLRQFTKIRFGRYFHCEVYFINHSIQMSVPWGTKERVNTMLEVEDGKALPLSIGTNGTMNLQADPEQVQKLLTYLLGTGRSLSQEDIQAQFNSMLNTFIKSYLGQVLQEKHYNAFSLDQHLQDISDALKIKIAPEFEKYGLILREFYVTTFALPEDNHAFQQARLLYEQRYAQHGQLDLEMELGIKQAEQEARLAEIRKRTKITDATADAEANVVIAQGEAARRNLEGITSIQEHQFDTMNRMVESGSSSGGGSMSGSGIGDMTGLFGDVMKMGVGMQMMTNVSGVMKDAMSGGAQTAETLNYTANTAASAPAQSAGWTCSCGQVNPEGSKFCGACGSPRVSEWVCPNCGTVNPASNRFCGGCGKKK
jgi:membrane protease subunit (stomatin/prohibitin family)